VARKARIEYAGAFHHVMSRGNDGIAIFRDDQDRERFLELLGEEALRAGWILHDFALMGNHYHLAIGTPECTLSTGMHRLLGRYVQFFNRRHRRRGHLFEGRFKNVLVEEASHGLVLSRYIALNPVRAGLCARPEEWPWSSYAARMGLAPPPPWLAIAPLFADLGSTLEQQRETYRSFVMNAGDCAGTSLDAAVGGAYLGTRPWIDRVQSLVDGVERSEEHPRDQVHPGRPALEDVIDAVATTFDCPKERLLERARTLERRFIAWLAFDDGLIPLRSIARRFGRTSAGAVSSMVARCRRELARSGDLLDIAEACRRKMRRRPPPYLAPNLRPSPAARTYHRLPSRSRRES